MTKRAKIDAVRAEVAGLADADRTALCDRWVACFGLPPPKGISRRLLERAAAYAIQARAFGGLKPKTRKALISVVGDPVDTASEPGRKPKPKLAQGTRLLRDWNGRTHEIIVIESGFVWNGKLYPSLSAVARAITGAPSTASATGNSSAVPARSDHAVMTVASPPFSRRNQLIATP